MDMPLGNPLLRPLSILLIALSLSIGWGIRGDFGHESGAWIPGALAALAVCALSGREDWRRRAAYCAMFGGLGWGFGGSIAYMYTLSFASSGQWESVWYGYFAASLGGGLWAGLGGAGTALPLCIDNDRLSRLFVPFGFVFVALVLNQVTLGPVAHWLSMAHSTGMDGTWARQKSPLYWFDADWWPAVWAVAGVCAYDLWERRFEGATRLALFGALGGLSGFLLQGALNLAGLTPRLVAILVVPQGDLSAIDPDTGKPFDPSNLMTNWPQFFGDFPGHVGWLVGLVLGVGVYFYRYGKWRNDAGLFLWMAMGWLLSFLIMPVLGSIPFQQYGGFRLTPPRSDDWAGVVGVFLGASAYALRNSMAPVALAGALNFVLGGLGFASIHFLRAMVLIPGHADLHRATGGTPPAWRHFQSANWHSILEQSQGFVLGVATALTMAALWSKLTPESDDRKLRRWNDVFSIGFVVFFMTYMNVFKNVAEWTRSDHRLVPDLMKAPLIESIELSALTWFNLAWLAISASFVWLMIVHQRRGLAVVPPSWLGRGQIIYFLVLWIMVIADFERSLNGFGEARLVTEWVIIMNASLATFLVMVIPGPALNVEVREPAHFGKLVARVWMIGLPCAAIILSLYALTVFRVYGKAEITSAQFRWGSQAVWRVKPILKNRAHR